MGGVYVPVHSESPIRLFFYGSMSYLPIKMLRLSLEDFPFEDGCVFN